MIGNQCRRLADGGIDFDHYRHRARRLRRASRRRTTRHCMRLVRPLIGAVVAAAVSVLIPAGIADCIICSSKPLSLVIDSHQ